MLLNFRVSAAVLLASVIYLPALSASAIGPSLWLSETKASDPDFQREQKRLEAVDPANAHELADTLAAIERKWAHRDLATCAVLIATACSRALHRSNSAETYIIARRYALSALARFRATPMQTKLVLAGVLLSDTARLAKTDWTGNRKEDSSWCLAMVRDIRANIDDSFDPKDMPQLNVAAPPGAIGVIPGMDPSGIRDPETRRRYAYAVDLNRRKSESYLVQRKLRDFDTSWSKATVQFLTAAYSSPPFDVPELRRLLKGSALSADERKAVLYAVEAKISAASTPAAPKGTGQK